MLSWTTTSVRIEERMAKAKAACSFSVNTAVCVKKPGPMAEATMRKAAPKRTLTVFFFRFALSSSNRVPLSSTAR